MAYKEMKLEKGEAKGLYDLWNSGMTEEEPKKKPAPKKKAATKTGSKKK